MAEIITKELLLRAMVDSGIDMVIRVKNLPKHLLYTKAPKMVTRYDRDGYTDGTLVSDPSGEQVDALHEGLSPDQTIKDCVVFNCGLESGKTRLTTIERFISGTLPRDVVVPTKVPYPVDPTDMRSAGRSMEDIPLVELPALITDSRVASLEVSPAAETAPPKRTLTLSEEQKAKKREILAKARAAKAAKKIS